MKKSFLVSYVMIVCVVFTTLSEVKEVLTNEKIELIRIGTNYGGWTIPKNFLDQDSICYCAGVGEDISFDIGLIQRYNCNVYSFDPTPRAISHIDYVRENISSEKTAYINNGALSYKLDALKLTRLHFFPVGLWHEDVVMRFYEPKNTNHVSHSILNLQKTENYFEVPCKRLTNLMKELGHDRIDLLKLDIEGAECVVLDSIVSDKLNIRCICIEFDEFAGANLTSNIDLDGSRERANSCINKLLKCGYRLIYQNKFVEMLFLKD